MKEMMIRLPMIEMAASDNTCLAKHYPKSGRYIIRRDNGDTSVADVQLRPIGKGEARSDDEQATVYECFLGQPDLLDPDDWALAIDIENVKLASQAAVNKIKEEMENLKAAHNSEMVELQEKIDATLAMRRNELEHEYELKKMQLELDTPKRFAQGEWVSGKTLKEIVEVLARDKKED